MSTDEKLKIAIEALVLAGCEVRLMGCGTQFVADMVWPEHGDGGLTGAPAESVDGALNNLEEAVKTMHGKAAIFPSPRA